MPWRHDLRKAWMLGQQIPDGGAVLDQIDWKWVVNVYRDNLAILEPQQQTLPSSWTPHHLDIPACQASLPPSSRSHCFASQWPIGHAPGFDL